MPNPVNFTRKRPLKPTFTPDPTAERFNLLDLHQTQAVYQVQTGVVDLFWVSAKSEQESHRWQPICRLLPGEYFFGLGDISCHGHQLLAVGQLETTVLTLAWDSWFARTQADDELQAQLAVKGINDWPKQLSQLLTKNNLTPQDTLDCQLLLENSDAREQLVTWYEQLLPQLVDAVIAFNEQQKQQVKETSSRTQRLLRETYGDMLSILNEEDTVHLVEHEDSLTPACQHIADALHTPLSQAVQLKQPDELTQLTGIQFRRIKLSDPNWWQQVLNPILVVDVNNNYCAVIQNRHGQIELINPTEKTRTKLTPQLAEQLQPEALLAYRPLPQKKLTRKDLFSFALFGSGRDVLRLLLVGCLGGLLGLATPWFTGTLFDSVIPNADMSQMMQVMLALVTGALAIGVFEVIRAFTVIRISSVLNMNLEIAIWDRLIRLPVGFFKQYTTGDLTKRAMAVSGVRQLLSGVVANTILSGMFSLFNLGLLFYYDVKLALIAVLLAVIMLGYALFASFRQLTYYKALEGAIGFIAGFVVQIISGISKIQTSGKEDIAFAKWSKLNSRIKQVSYRANWLNATLTTFNEIWLPLMSLMIFAYISRQQAELTVGQFLAFNMAFGQFTVGLTGMAQAISSVIRTLPMLKRAMPIMENLPEVYAGKLDPGTLTGKIEVNNLVFRYTPTEQPILAGVSFSVLPGQHVAIVGPSGSGKSTLLRLLLGFEKPQQGRIYINDQDLTLLNQQLVRQQCGVVLQNGSLMPGSIFDNIVGTAPLTLEDAWEAAKKAGLLEDIKQMPMGMQTVISERGGTLSGGQQQRLMIARALAKNPKILFFDEATSALDNRTQAVVINSLDQLKITRLVVAHRLSTIQKADLILVMEQGKIVQQGDYQTLITKKGLFQEMAKRQLLEQA